MSNIRTALLFLFIVTTCDGKRIRRQTSNNLCQDQADIITLIDGSDSIKRTDFATLKSNLQAFTDKLDISPDYTRFGAIVFSSEPTTIGDVLEPSGDRYAVRREVGNLRQPRLGTDTATGLQRMKQMFQQKGRPGIPQIGIVITDGESLDQPLTASTAAMLKNSGVTLIAVAIGDQVSEQELRAIASDSNLLFATNTFNLNGLENLIKGQVLTVCQSSACDTNPCQNGGICSTTFNNGFTCQCPSGYTGTYCQTRTSYCATNPLTCQNGGTCVDTIGGGFYCQCLAGYFGTYCQSRTGYCASNPTTCQNGGTCFDTNNGGFRCQCPSGYTGTYCQTRISYCSTNPGTCQNGGVCIDTGNGGFYCQCPSGYTGTYCETRVGTPIICQNGGTAINTGTGYQCRCLAGYYGTYCQLNFFTTPTPFIPTPPADPSLCIDCKVYGGVGYNNHPTNCNKFVQCLFTDGVGSPMRAIIKDCPVGLWFNLDTFNCDFPENVPGCKNDPCAPGNIGRKYSDGASCRTYYTCENSANVQKCCPIGTGFNGADCVATSPCKIDCIFDRVGPLPGVCDKRAVPTNFYKYQQKVGDNWTTMDCAPGTNYNPATCSCSDHAAVKPISYPISTPSSGVCEPELDIQFNGDIVDSAHSWWIHQENVSVANGAGYFDGTSKLVITRFANLDYKRPLVIKVRYRSEGSFVSGKQAIVSNGDCFERPSAAIAAVGNGVEFLAQTDEMPASTTINVNANSGNWNDAVFIGTDGRFEGIVNGARDSTDIKGYISKKPCALTIGAGTGYNNFVGFIDYVQVYLCMPNIP